MSTISIQHRPIKAEGIHLEELSVQFDKMVEKVVTATINYFRNGALYILPLVKNLTGSKRIAEAIIDGAFSGLVLGLAFRVLGIPVNNLVLNSLSAHLFRTHFSLFPNCP
jgi:uncharacterized membrane protein